MFLECVDYTGLQDIRPRQISCGDTLRIVAANTIWKLEH